MQSANGNERVTSCDPAASYRMLERALQLDRVND